MRNKIALLTIVTFGLFVLMLMGSCKSGLDERQQLFLDYAELEDRYSNGGYYRDLDLYNLNIEPANYGDSAFKFSDFKAQFLKNFKLVARGNRISPELGAYELQYPHQYVLLPQKDGSFNVKFSVFVPDTYYKFSVDKSDLGKTISKDSTEVTLLGITNDGVTLMIVDKSERSNYDYTYDSADRKDFSERKRYVAPKDPGYEGLFSSESVEEPNASNTYEEDSLMRTTFSRLNISVVDDEGKTLLSEGRVNNFRHYLWYRNNDMPYPELASYYHDIRMKYKELDQDSLHKFYPIEIVNIRASGKVRRVDFFLRSKKGRVEAFELNNVKLQEEVVKPLIDEHEEFEPIANLTKADVSKLLKINFTTVPVKLNEPNYILLYASVPHAYNNKSMDISFSDIKLIGDQKDTVNVDEMDNGDQYFNISYDSRIRNLASVRFPATLRSAKKVTGTIELRVQNYYDKTFDKNTLPKGFSIGTDGSTLTINRNEPSLEEMVAIYAFDKDIGKKTLGTFRVDNYDYSSPNSVFNYSKKINKIVIRYKKEDGAMNEKIPFELLIPEPKKQTNK